MSYFFKAFLKFGLPAVPENVKVFDESGTEVDDDVFEDVVRDPSVGVLTIKHGAGLYLFHYSSEMYLILPIHNNFPYKIICNQTWIVPLHKPLGSQMSCLHPLTPVTHRIQSLLKKAPPVNE